ncbi:hypothetical protein ABTZ58_29770 [Streptomyces sp. NPDC094143]|uniref:hypothetical protein n=1 Tax=Streptomyces sp. NPDC094143 TaxID=3155310 RepID=UPI00332BA810
MQADWTALGPVTAAGVGVAVAVGVVFALGVHGHARPEGVREHRGGPGARGLGPAALCFLACPAVVAYGTYLDLFVPGPH